MVTLSWLLLIQLAAAILAIIDGILRVRARTGVLPILEIVVAALLALSLFVQLPVSLGTAPLTATLALILAIVLVLVLAFRGGRRVTPVLTVVALVLAIVTVLVGYGWLHIPGIN